MCWYIYVLILFLGAAREDEKGSREAGEAAGRDTGREQKTARSTAKGKKLREGGESQRAKYAMFCCCIGQRGSGGASEAAGQLRERQGLTCGR